MALSATVVGALMGLGTQMYSNALRKLPYMHHPWEYLLGMGLGAVLANQFCQMGGSAEARPRQVAPEGQGGNERRYFDGDE